MKEKDSNIFDQIKGGDTLSVQCECAAVADWDLKADWVEMKIVYFEKEGKKTAETKALQIGN